MPEHAPVRLSVGDLEDAYMFVCIGEGFDASAWVNRRTGQIHTHSPEFDELPDDDPEDGADCVAIPDQAGLEMGTNIVRDFTALKVPELGERIDSIFSRRGAYGCFKDLLDQEGKLQLWFDYEAERLEAALREWCEAEGFELGPR